MATRQKVVETYAGDYMRINIFPVRNYHKGKRNRKFKPSTAAQEKYNAKRTALHLADLLHANFCEGDFAIRLSYDGEAPDIDEGQRRIRAFLRKLKRQYARHDTELKYVYVTERGKNNGRVHHHVVVNACPALTQNPYFFKRAWNNGGLPGTSYVYVAPLEFASGNGMDFSDGGLTGLAKYMIFDKAKITSKRYGRSRNLKEPEVREYIGAVTSRDVENVVNNGDITDIAEKYPEYEIKTVQAEAFDASDPESPPVTGVFVTLYLVRKEMKFNCGRKK